MIANSEQVSEWVIAAQQGDSHALDRLLEHYRLSDEFRSNRTEYHARQAPYASAMVFYRLGFYREALATLPDEPSIKRWREAIAQHIR